MLLTFFTHFFKYFLKYVPKKMRLLFTKGVIHKGEWIPGCDFATAGDAVEQNAASSILNACKLLFLPSPFILDKCLLFFYIF